MEIKLNKPPLLEAVIQVDFSYDGEDFIQALDAFYGEISKDFPTLLRMEEIKSTWGLEGVSNEVAEHVGYRFESQDKKTILMISRGKFGFALVDKTYSNWENFQAEFFKVYNPFCDFLKLVKFQRVSMRYINEFFVSNGEEYPDLQLLLNFPYSEVYWNRADTSFKVASKDESISGTVRQSLLPREKDVQVLFDIDVFAAFEGADELNLKMRELRVFKNELFFTSMGTEILKKFEL